MTYLFRFLAICSISYSMMVVGQIPTTYRDCKNNAIHLPLGNVSFADQVINFQVGLPAPDLASQANPQNALSAPDYRNDIETPYNYLSLGCGGSVQLYFADNVLIDLPGDDLFIFEAGQTIEGARVEISQNGQVWLPVGLIRGSDVGIDIASVASANDYFRYVRLIDSRINCEGYTPGADIDAVAAIHTYQTLSFTMNQLFDAQTLHFKMEGKTNLSKLTQLVAKYNRYHIKIKFNNIPTNDVRLAVERADAIKSYLSEFIDEEYIDIQQLTTNAPNNSNTTYDNRQTMEVFFIERPQLPNKIPQRFMDSEDDED